MLKPKEVKSIYFGGGTPTLFPSNMIVELIERISNSLSVTSATEITVEANPGTISPTALAILLEGGVNRISLGAQSFDEMNLFQLGRIYGLKEIYQSLEVIDKLGLPNFSLDLIFGIPEQKLENWIDDLKKAINTGAPHISTYNLTIEEGTVFHDLYQKGELRLPDEQTQLDMYLKAKEMLADAGYQHYEISNFARSRFLCQHNLTYWDNLEYLGLGAGAHSFIGPIRSANMPDIDGYIQSIKTRGFANVTSELLDESRRMGETIMLGLRRLEGISFADFQDRFGHSIEAVFPEEIKELVANGFITCDNRIKLTEKGLIFSNEVFEEFILL